MVCNNTDIADILLTSVIKKYDVSVVLVVKSITEGKFTGGVHLGTLETGEVGLAPFYKFEELLSPQLKIDLAQVRKDIINGKIKTQP